MEKSKTVIASASALALSIAGCESTTASNQKDTGESTAPKIEQDLRQRLDLVRSQVALTFCRELAETPVVPESVVDFDDGRCKSWNDNILEPRLMGLVTVKRFTFDDKAVGCTYLREMPLGRSLDEYARSLRDNAADDVETITAEAGTNVEEFGEAGVVEIYTDNRYQDEQFGYSHGCHWISVGKEGRQIDKIRSNRADGIVDHYIIEGAAGTSRCVFTHDPWRSNEASVAERKSAQNRFNEIVLQARESLSDVVRTSTAVPRRVRRSSQRHR